MTYDQGRDARAPVAIHPNQRPYSREGARLSVALMLGLMAAFIAVGLWFYASNDDAAVATDIRPSAERSTTATGVQEQPLPKTPTPPTVPAQQNQ